MINPAPNASIHPDSLSKWQANAAVLLPSKPDSRGDERDRRDRHPMEVPRDPWTERDGLEPGNAFVPRPADAVKTVHATVRPGLQR